MVAAKVAGMEVWDGCWVGGFNYDSGFSGLGWWLDLLLKNFGSVLGSCTKWAIFSLQFMIKCS